jgi:hypothetical protein
MRLAIHARHRGISFGAMTRCVRASWRVAGDNTLRRRIGRRCGRGTRGRDCPSSEPSLLWSGPLRQEAFQFAVDSLARCAPVAADCGVRICVENVQLRPTGHYLVRRSSTACRHDRPSRRSVRSGYWACPR